MHPFRSLSVHRAHAVLMVLTLTLAVGANLVVFTIVNALWLRPRPVADPARVVVISNMPAVGGDRPIDAVKPLMLDAFRRSNAFDDVAGQLAAGGLMGDFLPRLVIDRVGHPIETLAVTSHYFSVLGVGVRGRDFTTGDDQLGAPAVAIISDQLWKSAFVGATDIVGATVATSHLPVQIIGIAPSGFRGARLGEQIDLWIPRNLLPRVANFPSDAAGMSADFLDHVMPLMGLARLRPGVTSADAERAIAQPRARFIVRPLSDVFGTPTQPTVIIREQTIIRILAVTAALVLVGGCMTLMALVQVHYERRRQELAVRLALGASRGQLARQLVGELLGLGVAGAVGAVLVTAWTIHVLPALSLPDGVDLGRLDLSIDWRVATIGIVAIIATIIAAAAVPILRFSRSNLVIGLISPTTTGAPSSLRLRRIMLGLHVVATVIVLVAAGLFVRTIAYGFGRGPGFDVDRTAFVDLQPSLTEFYVPSEGPDQPGDSARKAAAYSRLLEGLAALPGVEMVVRGSAPLFQQTGPILSSDVTVDSVTRPMTVFSSTDPPGYLEALGARMIAGRTLTAGDGAIGGLRAAVVTASFATTLWPESSSIGREFAVHRDEYQIVGVVSDIVCGSLRVARCARIYTATNAGPSVKGLGMDVTMKTGGDAAELIEPVRRLASQIFPHAVRLDVASGRDLVRADLGQERLGVWFFSGFGVVGLALGLGGVFGMVAYLAEAKRREFGLRMALGATHASLLRRSLFAGVWPVVFGTGAGLIAASAVARSIETMVYGVTRLDPLTYASIAGIMIGGAMAGGLAAAWRIYRLSPLEALRAE